MDDRPSHGSTATERPPRWVLDTNVLVSALLFPAGRLTWIRDAWRSGAIVPLASRETTTELIRVLCHPRFGLTPREREDLLADYLPHCIETCCLPQYDPQLWMKLTVEWLEENCAQYFPKRFASA